MANNYQHRLDRLEAAIAPKAQYFVWRNAGESTHTAAERYVMERGESDGVELVLEEGIFVGWES
jgi:hypothetical protein